MKQIIVIFLLLISASAFGQTFTFECFCRAEMTGDSCDICPGTVITSRSFSGLLIYRNGVKFRWIDQPYMVRTRPGNNVEFLEQGPTPDKITIALAQTPYSTMQGYIDSTYCTCGDLVPLWYASDSTNFSPIYQGDTVKIVGQGATTVTFDSVLQKYIVYSPPAGGSGTVTNFSFTDGSGFDGTVTNPTTTPNLSLQTTVTGPIYGAGGSLLPITVGSGLTFSAPTLSASDVSAANEGILGVGAGGASSSTILSNTTGATGVTINAAGINTITESTSSNGGSITITGTEVDGSVTNEAQTLAVTGTTTGILTLSTAGGAGGGTATIAGAGTNTVAQSGGTITITGTGGPGTGTVGYHPKWATSSTLSGTSFVYDRGNSIVLNGTTSGGLFTIKGIGTGAKDIYMGNGELKLQGPGATHWSMRTSEGGISGLYWSDTSSGDTIGLTGTNKMKLDAIDGLSIVSNFKLGTYKGTAATSLTGRDGSGYLTNMDLASGLSIVSGSLTPADNSATNEAQTLSIAGATNPTVTLSTAGGAGGGSFQLTNGTGIAITLAGTVATIASTGTATAWINGGNSFGGTPSIGNNDNVPLLFETNGTEKYRLTAAGELLLGTTTTGAKLNVSGIASTVGILAAGGSVASGTALMRATGTIATGFGYVFDGDASNAGGNIISRVRNSSNTASSNAIHQIAVAGTTALDPFTQYQVEGVSGNTWSVGISNANADKFCITPDVTPALSAIGFQMNTTGEGGFSSSPSANHSAIWGLNKPLGLPSGTSAGRALGTNSAIWYNSTILGTEIFCASHNIYKRLTSNGTPTINMVSNSGTGATAILSSGSNDMAGQITFTVGSTGILAGNQFEVQFAGSFSGQVFVDLQARNAAMAAQLANVFVGTQSTGSFFFTATSALGAGSILIFNYRVTQ